MQTGIHKLTYADYAAIDAVRQSDLKKLDASPKYYQYCLENPQPSTPSMDFGRLVHTKLLEPELFDSEFACFDGKVRRGKDWEAFKEGLGDKICITKTDLATLNKMNQRWLSHPFVSDMMPNAVVEQSTVWEDFATGLKCKARQDIVVNNTVMDLKTTTDISSNSIYYSLRKYGYLEQAAFYLDGLNAATGQNLSEFYFIFIEKTEPYDIRVISLSQGDLDYGREQNSANLARIKECTESGNWPGYFEMYGIEDSSGLKA